MAVNVSKWHQSLDDKSVCSVCSLMAKFNVDLSFSEMKKFYSIKFEKLKERQGKHK